MYSRRQYSCVTEYFGLLTSSFFDNFIVYVPVFSETKGNQLYHDDELHQICNIGLRHLYINVGAPRNTIFQVLLKTTGKQNITG